MTCVIVHYTTLHKWTTSTNLSGLLSVLYRTRKTDRYNTRVVRDSPRLSSCDNNFYFPFFFFYRVVFKPPSFPSRHVICCCIFVDVYVFNGCVYLFYTIYGIIIYKLFAAVKFWHVFFILFRGYMNRWLSWCFRGVRCQYTFLRPCTTKNPIYYDK